MKKKAYVHPEVDIEVFTITADVFTTSGFGWEEEDDEFEAGTVEF